MNPGQTLFTMPSVSQLAASTSPGSNAIFTDFLPMIFFIIAVAVFLGALAIFLRL